jgi:cobalamin synthase
LSFPKGICGCRCFGAPARISTGLVKENAPASTIPQNKSQKRGKISRPEAQGRNARRQLFVLAVASAFFFALRRHSERSSESPYLAVAFAVAVVLAFVFLAVIPEGNLRLGE